MLRINSIMLTVLPTPAPPNNPTLPPFANGHTKSITLIPVSNNSSEAACSAKEGAARCIGNSWSESIGPASSIGFPRTSIMRPKVPLPTGTEIGLPVFSTESPRRNPSVTPIAMVRTIPPPICSCTSRIKLPSTTLSAS